MIIVLLLAAVILARIEFLYPINVSSVSWVGFSFLKFFLTVLYLSVISIYMTHLKYFLSAFRIKIFYSTVSFFTLLLISNNNLRQLTQDTTLLITSVFFAVCMVVFGNSLFSTLVKLIKLNEGEINKAFITYPPKGFMDMFFLYVFILIFIFMPEFIESFWDGIKGHS